MIPDVISDLLLALAISFGIAALVFAAIYIALVVE